MLSKFVCTHGSHLGGFSGLLIGEYSTAAAVWPMATLVLVTVALMPFLVFG